MADKPAGILVDKDLRPAYYDDFHCLAAGCKLSCCKGWNITFNKKDYLSIKRQNGSDELNAKLESGVRRLRKGSLAEQFYGESDMSSGVCPFLGEDSLCTLQVEKGHSALPYVCRSYPRGEAYMMSGYLERSLSPSCEGVLKLLWDLPDGIEFRSDPLPKTEHKRVTANAENPMPLWFPVVREWCIDLLQDRRFPLPHRIFLMGLGLKELADGEKDIDRWMERAVLLPETAEVSSLLSSGSQELAMYLSDCVRTLMGILTSDQELAAIRQKLMDDLKLEPNLEEGKLTIPFAPYQDAKKRWESVFSEQKFFMENLMVCIFFHLHMPHMSDPEALWKSYVNFCNLYAIYHFLAVMSCREGVVDNREELFRLLVFASRSLIHNGQRQSQLRDEFFKNDSATLAHMAILLGG